MLPSAFVDEAVIAVSGGRGGDGTVSFERTRAHPRGGPDGGNGGSGGNVLARADTGTGGSLAIYKRQRRWSAQAGFSGAAVNRHGADGDRLVLLFPPGTDILDEVSGDLHISIRANEGTAILARGGCGGRGNSSFKSAVNRAPRQRTSGEPGQDRNFRLVLRLPADVALLGSANSGKSSLLTVLSNARPAIAEYEFTTLFPQLGVHETEHHESFVIVEIPGIFPDSKLGQVHGRRFLRHASRCRLLVFLISCANSTKENIIREYNDLLGILDQHSEEYKLSHERIIVLSKSDLSATGGTEELAVQVGRKTGTQVCRVSAHTGEGLSGLLGILAGRLGKRDHGGD